MSEQDGLFALADIGVTEAEHIDKQRRTATAAVVPPPPERARWRRTALRRDCTGCWEHQDREFKAGNLLYSTRRPATVELTLWDATGTQSTQAFYCTQHAEELGWNSARPANKRAKSPAQPTRNEVVNRRLATELADLATQAKRGHCTRAWQRAVTAAIGRAGGNHLEQPSWGITSSGQLTGSVTGPVKRVLTDWVDVFGGDIETERTPGETRLHLTCQVAHDPVVEVFLSGSLDRDGMAL